MGLNLDKYIDWLEFYGRYAPGLKPSGRDSDTTNNVKCPLPGHGEKQGSFGLAKIKGGVFKCLGCEKYGNAQTFLVEMGICNTINDATQWLIREYNISENNSGDRTYTPSKPKAPAKNLPAPKTLNTGRPIIPEAVWQIFPPVETAIEWIRKKELETGKILGWSDEGIRIADVRLQTVRRNKSGTIVKIDTPERLAIPVRDLQGNLINIRLYKPFHLQEGEGKTISWGKGYGENALLLHEFDPEEWHIICEGERDWITAISNGMNASMQTAQASVWPEEYLEKYKGKKVIAAGDADKHGISFNATAVTQLSGVSKETRTVVWPDYMGKDPVTGEWPDGGGQDLTDYFVKHGGTKKNFGELTVGQRLEIVDFFVNRQLSAMADQAWEIVQKHNSPPVIFDSSDGICRIDEDRMTGEKQMKSLSLIEIRNHLKSKVRFLKKTKSKKSPTGESTDDVIPPNAIFEDMMAEPVKPVPYLFGIMEHPFYDRKMNLHSQPGYSETSGFYLKKNDIAVPNVNQSPTPQEVGKALTLLREIQHDFPYIDAASRANDLAATIQPFVRMAIAGPVPAYGFDAPMSGEGKSLKVDAITQLVNDGKTAHKAECRDDEEWRKTITSTMKGRPELICIDNIRRTLDSGSIANWLTCRIWQDRELQYSKELMLPMVSTVFMTGNNLSFSTEISRRVVVIRIDSNSVNAAEKKKNYLHDPLLKWITENRGQLIWAALTLIQNWKAKGMPAPSSEVPNLASYEEYRRVIGGILESAGVKHFLGNFKKNLAENDTEKDGVSQLANEWYLAHGFEQVKAADIYQLIISKQVPINVMGKNDIAKLTAFGKFMNKIMKGRVFRVEGLQSEFRLVKVELIGTRCNAKIWKLTEITNTGGGGDGEDSNPDQEPATSSEPYEGLADSPNVNGAVNTTKNQISHIHKEPDEGDECFPVTHVCAHANIRDTSRTHVRAPGKSLHHLSEVNECETKKGVIPINMPHEGFSDVNADPKTATPCVSCVHKKQGHNVCVKHMAAFRPAWETCQGQDYEQIPN